MNSTDYSWPLAVMKIVTPVCTSNPVSRLCWTFP